MRKCAVRQAKRRVACGVALEDLAPVMHVAETWEERGVHCAVVRTSRCPVHTNLSCKPEQAVCMRAVALPQHPTSAR